MKFKSILLFVLLVAIVASFNLSCQKNDPEIENQGVSDGGGPVPPPPPGRDTIPY